MLNKSQTILNVKRKPLHGDVIWSWPTHLSAPTKCHRPGCEPSASYHIHSHPFLGLWDEVYGFCIVVFQTIATFIQPTPLPSSPTLTPLLAYAVSPHRTQQIHILLVLAKDMCVIRFHPQKTIRIIRLSCALYFYNCTLHTILYTYIVFGLTYYDYTYTHMYMWVRGNQ